MPPSRQTVLPALLLLALVLATAPASVAYSTTGQQRFEGLTIAWTLGDDEADVRLIRNGATVKSLHLTYDHSQWQFQLVDGDYRASGGVSLRHAGAMVRCLYLAMIIDDNGTISEYDRKLTCW